MGWAYDRTSQRRILNNLQVSAEFTLLKVTQIKMPIRLMQKKKKKKKTLGTLGIGRDREMGTLILGGNINWIAFGEAIW